MRSYLLNTSCRFRCTCYNASCKQRAIDEIKVNALLQKTFAHRSRGVHDLIPSGDFKHLNNKGVF